MTPKKTKEIIISNDQELTYKVSEYEIKNHVLEEKLDEMTRSYASQFAKIKREMTEQGAKLLISE